MNIIGSGKKAVESLPTKNNSQRSAGGIMERMYSFEDAEKLRGKLVICDERSCDGKGCSGLHHAAHIYDDEECFHNCEWPGHSGLCILLDAATTKGERK